MQGGVLIPSNPSLPVSDAVTARDRQDVCKQSLGEMPSVTGNLSVRMTKNIRVIFPTDPVKERNLAITIGVSNLFAAPFGGY